MKNGFVFLLLISVHSTQVNFCQFTKNIDWLDKRQSLELIKMAKFVGSTLCMYFKWLSGLVISLPVLLLNWLIDWLIDWLVGWLIDVSLDLGWRPVFSRRQVDTSWHKQF